MRVMVLKGAALLLGGRTPGARSMSDIDVIASPSEARQLHSTLRARLGYDALSASPEHHLPTLTRPGALPVEIHIQLGPRRGSLDARIWLDAQNVTGTDLVVPSPTSALLHALEHGALVHWAVRYRLRDLLDVADAWEPGIDGKEVGEYLRHHPQCRALTTMLGGARRFAPAIPIGRRSAWRTVRRVARVRHLFAAHVRDAARATSLCIARGVGEGSPARLRPAQLALSGSSKLASLRCIAGIGQPACRLAAAKVRENLSLPPPRHAVEQRMTIGYSDRINHALASPRRP